MLFGSLLDRSCRQDGCSRLREAGPAAFGIADRARLVAFLADHPDPLVRGNGGHLLASWDEHDALIRLVSDARFLVMKDAMFALGKATPNAAAALCARQHLDAPRVTSTHAYETLETSVAHAPPTEAIPLLTRLVAEDERETVRFHAVHALIKLGAAREIERLLPLLEEPPRVTWGVHIALLQACRRLGLTWTRGPGALRDVDNVDLQAAIA